MIRGKRARLFAVLVPIVLAPMLVARAQDVTQLSHPELEQRVEEIFERSCAQVGCHAGPVAQQDMFLTSRQYYASVVDKPSVGRPDMKIVVPGDPDNSYLMMKLTGAPGIVGVQMPLIGDKMTDEELEILKAWIAGLEVDEARMGATETEEAFPFDGWKAINLPTTRTVDRGSWLFLISHRFNPPVSDGYDAFYGLDGSGIIFLSMGYAFTDDFVVSLARSNAADNVELWSRYRIGQQGVRGWPVGLGVQAAVNWVTEEPTVADRYSSDAFKFTGQVTVSREVGSGLGLAVVPGLVLNPVEGVDGEDVLLTLGLAGQWNFHRNLSIVGEWVPIVSGYTRSSTFGNDIRFDSWGTAFQIATGGHVFQIVLSNSVGLTSDQYLRGGDLDISDVDVRLGFNIFRVINF